MNAPRAIEMSGHYVFDVGTGKGGGPYYSEVVDFAFRYKVVFTRYEKGIASSKGVIYVANCMDSGLVLARLSDMFHWAYAIESVTYYTSQDIFEERFRAQASI